ncbi:MAG: hypothetical protein ACTSRH_03220 [Promethearchaeota archaeon]
MTTSSKGKRYPCEGLADVYVMYFDEERGHIPLLIYPTEKLKDDKNFMRPIKYHPIWFLSVNEQEALDHIDLEFKGYIFFGKKFLTLSRRKKRRAGLNEETPENIVIIVCLPEDLEIFGDDLIQILTKEIKEQFSDKLYRLIEYEILKEELIKTPKIQEILEEGKYIKEELFDLIANICQKYFNSVIKETDTKSIKRQKALSFLALKGYDVSYLVGGDNSIDFSSIKIFDPLKKSEEPLSLKEPFEILNIEVLDDSRELEILVKNNTKEEKKNTIVKITHVQEFFEKEILNQKIDVWFPEEELLFYCPIIAHIHEYLFFIIEGESNTKILSKKIDLNLINIGKKTR